MKDITFNELPQAVTTLLERLDSIEKLLRNPKAVPSEDTPHFMRIDEAASFLLLAKPTIYGFARTRSIPVHKRGRRLYFLRNELIDWVQGDLYRTTEKDLRNIGI